MISSFCTEAGIFLCRDLPLSEHTTFRIGGTADYAVFPDSPEQVSALLVFLKKNNIRYFTLGKGSDVLADDRGYRGVLILTERMKHIYAEGTKIFCGAGCSMASVANLAKKTGLAGLEFLHGIPGSMGGGIFMNAGAYGSELSTYVESVEWVDEQGEIHVSDSESLDFSYRHSFFTDHPGIVCSVVLQCVRGNTEDIAALIHDLDARRREKQPLEYPSAGSSFKRPEGYYAGKLIEDCGLKGCRVGGACVSEKHAGFIVNTGGATSRDVFALVEHITEVVYQRFGVVLEPEIRFLEAE